MPSYFLKRASYLYLALIPIIATIIGFNVTHLSYAVYVPIWIINAVLMGYASWLLGLHIIERKGSQEEGLAKAAFLLIVPWIIITIFAGFGPPPENATDWTATASEQQVRYALLVISGLFIAFGFISLKDQLHAAGENFYSMLGSTAILVAIPLFIVNMIYWGFYLTELFNMQAAGKTGNEPDWFQPIKHFFRMVSVVEVALTYLGTLVMVLALQKIGWIGRRSTFLYILFSFIAFVIIILYPFCREALAIPGYAVSIPAFPFLLPYFLGVNLLRRAGGVQTIA